MNNHYPISAQEFFFEGDSTSYLNNIKQPQSFENNNSKPKPFLILGLVILCGLVYHFHNNQKVNTNS